MTQAALAAFRDTLVAIVRSAEPDMTQRQLATLLVCQASRSAPTISAIAEQLNVAKTVVSRAVTVLEERGLVARMALPSDQRAVAVGMTPDGRRHVQAIQVKAQSAYVMSGVR